MTEETSIPPVAGRPARIAVLVYADAHDDSRVIKTCETLRASGADVRVYAVSRPGYPAGRGSIGRGIPVMRARQLDVAGGLRRASSWASRLAGGSGGTPRGGVTPAPQDGPSTSAPASRARTAGTVARLRAAASERFWGGAAVANLTRFWWESFRAARTWRPDVVWANDGNTLVPAHLLARDCEAQLVYDSHELWRHRNVLRSRLVAGPVEAAIESFVIRRAAAVVTVSPSIAAWLRSEYTLERPVHLVRNTPTRRHGPGGGRLRELAGLGPDQRVVAYSGGITTGRGLHECVDALAQLPADVHLVVLGRGTAEHVAGLRDHAGSRRVSDRVHVVGPVAPDEVSVALSDADLAIVYIRPVCLSYRFALPNKVFEAIQAGLPVIAADLPDLAELVRTHGVGRVFPVDGDAGALAAAITGVLADRESYAAATARAAQTLTWEHEAAGVIAAVREALRAGVIR